MVIDNLEELYRRRFEEEKLPQKNAIWKVLCNDFFQKYIRNNSTVLDIGAGYCEFINNIQCAKKYAVDLNEDTTRFASPDVKVFKCPSTDLSVFADASIDISFLSNFFEHLKSREDILITLSEVFRILKPGGGVLILQPNIRYLYKEYWDYFDHQIPLSDKSLTEALQITGFTIEKIIDRFLPYTTRSRIPQKPWLVKFYLKMPFIWKVMGKQAFIYGTKHL
jgi:ubiquinone/menaquinone biosynthesis C-methylase UbiE